MIRKAVPILAVFALLEVIVVGSVYWVERSSLERDMFGSFVRTGPSSDRFEIFFEGIHEPPTVSAAEARLNDSEEVIGIEVGGRARAYRLAALREQWQHIINDVVSGVPVTITYCDVAECVRAFTDHQAYAPLDVSQAGMKADRMVLKIGGVDYLQDSGESVDPGAIVAAFPYERFPTTRTSWKAWKQSHPDTDVYVAAPGSGP